MVLSKKKLLLLLEGEALRHRGLARLSGTLPAHHLETAQALETARAMLTQCRFKRLDTKGRKP